jgi:hypothetical protein
MRFLDKTEGSVFLGYAGKFGPDSTGPVNAFILIQVTVVRIAIGENSGDE